MSNRKIPPVPEGADKEWFLPVENPLDLRDKVPEFGGVDPEEAFEKIDQIMVDMKQEYVEKLSEDIEALEGLVRDYKEDNDPEHLKNIYSLVHNMRGQGATFDFPLVSAIGTSFCRYAMSKDDMSELSIDLVMQHLEALKVVRRENIKGQGDKLARTVVIALEKAVEIIVEREKKQKEEVEDSDAELKDRREK